MMQTARSEVIKSNDRCCGFTDRARGFERGESAISDMIPDKRSLYLCGGKSITNKSGRRFNIDHERKWTRFERDSC